MAAATSLQMNWLPLQTRKGGPLGLKNLGNSCYLNSVLQCLTYTPPLANFCLLNHHSSSCTFMNGSSNSVCPFCLVEKRISRSLSVDSISESPARIHSCLALFAKHFRQGWQEDAHEFLRYVIEACNSVCVKLHKLLAASSKLRTRQGCQKVSKEEPRTVVKDIFGGILQSQVKCLSCNAESNKLDDIMDLSLDVFKTSSVREAMCRFFQPEVLDGSNKYKCEKCRKLTAARKQMSVSQAPNVLVIQLKRFENIYGGKIDRHISFDERMELLGYMCCESQDQGPEYYLYAVIVHAGYSQDSGHYYSYVKDVSGKWYCCNDAHVTPVSAKSVLSEKAYILFYVRRTFKASSNGCSRNGNAMSTLTDETTLRSVESQESSTKDNGATVKSNSLSSAATIDTQEPSTKENGINNKLNCFGKGDGAPPVRFNIMKHGPQNHDRKPLTAENGRAGRSITDSGQSKRLFSNGAVSNGSLESSSNVKKDDGEFQKHGQAQGAGIQERVSKLNGNSNGDVKSNGFEGIRYKAENNGHKVRVPLTVEEDGTDVNSNGHSGSQNTEKVSSSFSGVSQVQQMCSQPLQKKAFQCGFVDESKKVTKIQGNLVSNGVKRKVPNGFLLDEKLKETEHSQELIGEALVKQHIPGKSSPAKVSDLHSLKLWLANDSRQWLLQSGWCDTVRNTFREMKKARLIQDSQLIDRKAESLGSDTFASAHDSLRQIVPKELKEHLVEQLHAHFVAQQLKEK